MASRSKWVQARAVTKGMMSNILAVLFEMDDGTDGFGEEVSRFEQMNGSSKRMRGVYKGIR